MCIIDISSQEKFTEKYKKQIEYFVSLLGLPSYCSVKFIENRPYDVKVQLVINFPEMLKDTGVVNWTSHKVEEKLKNYFQNNSEKLQMLLKLRLLKLMLTQIIAKKQYVLIYLE